MPEGVSSTGPEFFEIDVRILKTLRRQRILAHVAILQAKLNDHFGHRFDDWSLACSLCGLPEREYHAAWPELRSACPGSR